MDILARTNMPVTDRVCNVGKKNRREQKGGMDVLMHPCDGATARVLHGRVTDPTVFFVCCFLFVSYMVGSGTQHERTHMRARGSTALCGGGVGDTVRPGPG